MRVAIFAPTHSQLETATVGSANSARNERKNAEKQRETRGEAKRVGNEDATGSGREYITWMS